MTTTIENDTRTCAICHQAGGWTFRDYGESLAHSDCIDRVGADYVPSLEELQRAERDMWALGYYFRDSCGWMSSPLYHDEHVRRYHIAGAEYHFASWASFQQWLADAWSYYDHTTAYQDDWKDGWSD